MKTAGCRALSFPDPDGGTEPRMLVLHPADAAERLERFGPYELSVAMNAPVADGRFPLVVVSHGSGGWHLLYRGLAEHLARRGFVVALVEHPRNNRNDNSLAGTDTLLETRPRELRLAIDRAYGDEALAPHLVADAVAVVGHSMGGYAGLALAGGRPGAAAHETADRQPRAVAVTPDARVQALVLLAPATPWFLTPGALRDVRAPILMLTGERDEQTPAWHAQIVLQGVPDPARVEHRVVAGAGHYSFLAPFPPSMATPEFRPAHDPPGFDRPAFHATMHDEVEAFLGRVLG